MICVKYPYDVIIVTSLLVFRGDDIIISVNFLRRHHSDAITNFRIREKTYRNGLYEISVWCDFYLSSFL